MKNRLLSIFSLQSPPARNDVVIKILGRADSINVRKVLWLCDELNIAYEREDWGRGFQSPQAPEFVKLNPNATIPVIIDGDFVLWQSKDRKSVV